MSKKVAAVSCVRKKNSTFTSIVAESEWVPSVGATTEPATPSGTFASPPVGSGAPSRFTTRLSRIASGGSRRSNASEPGSDSWNNRGARKWKNGVP